MLHQHLLAQYLEPVKLLVHLDAGFGQRKLLDVKGFSDAVPVLLCRGAVLCAVQCCRKYPSLTHPLGHAGVAWCA